MRTDPAGGEGPLALARAAARRWKSRTTERKGKLAALADGRPTDADTPERLCRRIERLAAWRDVAVPAEAARALPLRPSDVTDRLVERQIGRTRDLLSIEFFELGLDAARSVGLIVIDGQASGTGFLVAPDLVMTNRHVLRDAGEAGRSSLDLDFEANRFGAPKSTQSFRLQPERFFLNDATLDYALCAVAPVSGLGKPLRDYGFRPLIGEEGKIAIGEAVNVVQHPAGRVKQIVIRNNRLVDLPDEPALKPFFHYEADTEPGSSGSPVFNDQWEIVALHHSGVPKTNAKGQLVDAAGKAITGAADTGRIVWVANEGIRVSQLVRHIAGTTLPDEAAAIRDRTIALWASLGAPAVQIAVLKPHEPEPQPAMALAEAAAAPFVLPAPAPAELTIPLQVQVRLGAPTRADPDRSRLAAASALERIEPDPSDPRYERRPGYDPTFLGFAAPLPAVVDDGQGPVAVFGDGATELRYHHYSVLMNARRRLAYLAACNINLAARFQHEREGGDRWFFDPRLPRRLQAGSEYYTDNPLDRGHLVRRADVAWGADAEEARHGNDDSFHWTNCSPQHQIFNQSQLASQRGLLLWGNLENAVAQLAGSHGNRLSVLNGPVFADGDRPYRRDFLVPAEFWKLILVKDGMSKPRALAFRLSQADQITNLPRERFQPDELAPYVPFQVRIADLAALTGLDLQAFMAWDPLATVPGRRDSTRGSPAVRRITSERDLVF